MTNDYSKVILLQVQVTALSNRKLPCHCTLKNKIAVLLIKAMIQMLCDLAIQLVSKSRSSQGTRTVL